jgi:hypothetical protein
MAQYLLSPCSGCQKARKEALLGPATIALAMNYCMAFNGWPRKTNGWKELPIGLQIYPCD